jgi:hypothetical protein
MSKMNNDFEWDQPGVRLEHFQVRAIKARISKEIKIKDKNE